MNSCGFINPFLPSIVRCISVPRGQSSNRIERSIPGNCENGPDVLISAIETRQLISSQPAPSGSVAISIVVPPPFFHVIT